MLDGTESYYGNLGLGRTLEVDLLLSIVRSAGYFLTMLDCSRAVRSDPKIYKFVIFYYYYCDDLAGWFQLI